MIRTSLSVELPTSYFFEPVPSCPNGLLLLHGFSDLAVSVRKRLLGSEALPNFNLLAPNGLFPSPVRRGNSFKEAYSWYFRDPESGNEMISPQFAAESLVRLIDGIGQRHLEWVIVGFSQGGFLAPVLAQAGLKVRMIIAVGAAFREETYAGLSPMEVHGIHGDQDEVIDHPQSLASYEKILRLGFTGKYHTLTGLKHTLNEEGRVLLRSLLTSYNDSKG